MAATNPATSLVEESLPQLSIGMKIGVAIMAAFVLYLIARNRLGVYIGLFTG